MPHIDARYEALLRPSERLIEDIKKIEGDIMLLGVGGKMGPSMARLAKEAIDAARISKKVIGVSRFSQPGLREKLDGYGIETYAADLLDRKQLETLPLSTNSKGAFPVFMRSYGEQDFWKACGASPRKKNYLPVSWRK